MPVIVFYYLSSRFLSEGHKELFLMASNQASMDQWITAITNVIQGYHIVKTIVEEVEQEATLILTETEETCLRVSVASHLRNFCMVYRKR